MARFYLVILFTVIMTSCASPSQNFAVVALAHGFTQNDIKGQPFLHRIYANRLSLQASPNQTLHVYLDGDGTPWDHQSEPSADPTSRNPLILSLLAQDSAPSILLGRPCYHGLQDSVFCHNSFWTAKRYSAEVVDSLVIALNKWRQQHPFKKIWLIGYSGGGVLAVLMADKIPALQTVVTIAANLDVAAWCRAHGYDPLTQSLNPILQKKLPPRIKQIHLAGAEDAVVPAYITKAYAQQQQNITYQLFPDFDHLCCWEEAWPKILPSLQ